MASGSFAVASSNGNVSATLNWESTPNTSENTSSVYCELRASRTNSGYTTYGSGSATITINGTACTVSIDSSQKITQNSNTLLGYGSVTVPHDSAGNATIDIIVSAYISAPLTLGETTGTVTLDSIPRTSIVTAGATSCTMRDGSITYYTNRASTSFTHKFYYAFGSIGWTLFATDVTDSYTWTPPITLAQQIPSATSGYGTILCETYVGSTYIGGSTVGFTVYVPSDIIPSAAISYTNSSLLNGYYIQNKSSLSVTTNFTGNQGSTRSSTELLVTNSTHSYSYTYTGTTNTVSLPYADGYQIKARVKDSRGRYSNYTNIVSISAYAYSDPYISTFTCYRSSNSTGTASDTGTYIYYHVVGGCSSCYSQNAKVYTFYYKLHSSSTWTSVTLTSAYSVDTTGYISGISADNAYDVKVTVTDSYKTVTSIGTIPTAFVLLDLYNTGTGLAVGKVAETATLFEIAMNTTFNSGFTENHNGVQYFYGTSYLYGTSTYLRNCYVNSGYTETVNGTLTVPGTFKTAIINSTSTSLNIGIKCSTYNSTINTIYFAGDAIYPIIDNFTDMGSGNGYMWKAVYARNGTIQTSNRQNKSHIHYLDDAVPETALTASETVEPTLLSAIALDVTESTTEVETETASEQTDEVLTTDDILSFVKKLSPATFTYKDADGNEISVNDADKTEKMDCIQLGLIADDIQEEKVFKYIGVDYDYSKVITPAVFDDDGNVTTPAVTEEAHTLGLQALPLAVLSLSACKNLIDRIETLEVTVAKLEECVNKLIS